jgi:uncharacterized cupin superfamily protein
MGPVNEADLDWTDHDHGENGFRRKKLGAAAGGDRLGCSLYELPAGKRAWPYHYHAGNEEALYALSGTGRLRLDGETHPLEPGDYVAFPEGEESAHQVTNPGDDPFRYLVVSTMDEPEVLGYPDSGKVGVMVGDPPGGDEAARDFEGYFRTDDAVDFWDGE